MHLPLKQDSTVRENLKVVLSATERMDYALKLAQATQELEELENRKKRIVDDLKAQASRHEADVSICSTRVRDGYEYRDVECQWEYDPSENPPKNKFLVRIDTFDLVRRALLEKEEVERLMQFQLPLADPPADPLTETK